MKLICLNIWSGIIFDPLMDFINKNSDTDIFCFQEMTHGGKLPVHVQKGKEDMLEIISKALLNFQYFYSPFETSQVGNSIFINKKYKINKFMEEFVYGWYGFRADPNDPRTLGRNIQCLEFSTNNETYSIFNFHGLWNGKGKSDANERIDQSIKVKDIVSNSNGKKILCGDFNLLPDTKSLEILEKDMVNLIKTNNIKSTRSVHYDKYETGSRFADYILVSKNVSVLDFKVLQEEVSDHLPLYIEFI